MSAAVPVFSPAWEKEFFGPVVGPALGREGVLYLVDPRHCLQCLSKTGKLLWNRELHAPAVALAVNSESGEIAVLLQPGRLLCLTEAGAFAWATEVDGEPAGLDVQRERRSWLFAAHSGLCREYQTDGTAGASYDFQPHLLAACYLGRDGLAGVSATGRLVLLYRPALQFQTFPLDRYVAGISADRAGTVLALPAYKEGILLVRPQARRMDTCDLERNVLEAVLSEDGEFLLAGADDGMAALIRPDGAVVCSWQLGQAISGLALAPGLAQVAVATAAGRVYVLESRAGQADRYEFMEGDHASAEPVPELSAAWSLRLFSAEHRGGPRRLWLLAGARFVLSVDEYHVLHLLETNGRLILKRDFLGERLHLAPSPAGELVLAGDEYQLVAISLSGRTLIPLPSPAWRFSASDQGHLVLLSPTPEQVELFFLGQRPELLWRFKPPAAVIDLSISSSGERWFALLEDGRLCALDLDQKLLWTRPVFAVPDIGPARPRLKPAVDYRLRPWGQNLLLVSPDSVTAYAASGEQLWCVRGKEKISAAEPLGAGVILRGLDQTWQWLGPDGRVMVRERVLAEKTFYYLDSQSQLVWITGEGKTLTGVSSGRPRWRFEAPHLVEEAAAGPEGVAVIAGEFLLWLDLTAPPSRSTRFDYLDF